MNPNFKHWWGTQSRAARRGLAVGCLVIASLVAALAWWTMAPAWQVLFTDLDGQDASAIVSELDRLKLPYRFARDGRDILVEQEQVHKTRLQLMDSGVKLKGTVGFEIFNEPGFGMTDFAQRINYQRALQGELARTIMSLDEVKAARVHLVVPEPSFLKKSATPAKASVTVTTRAANKLGAQQVQGIQRLVAAAVPEIEASAVTVLDSSGVILSRATEAGADGVQAEGRLALKQQAEQYLARKLGAILDKSIGAGLGAVSVDLSLDHDNLKVTREDVLPASTRHGDADGAVLRRKQVQQRGAPAAATPTQAGSRPVAGMVADEDGSTEVEYLHGRRIEQLVSAPGSVKRMGIGVVIPDGLPPERIAMLEKLLASAAGVDSKRGDVLAIYSQQGAGNPEASLDRRTLARAAAIQDEPASLPGAGTSASRNPVAPEPGPAWWAAACALAILLLAALAWLARPASWRKAGTQRLGPDERERRLQQLQAWLAEPAPGKAGDRR